MTTTEMAYVGRKPCGCVVAAFVDRPEYAKEIAKEIAKWIRTGLAVERMTVEEARPQFSICKCDEAAEPERKPKAQMELA